MVMTTPVTTRRREVRGAVQGPERERGHGSADLDALLAALLRIADEEHVSDAIAAVRALSSMTPDADTRDALMARGLTGYAADLRARLNRDDIPQDKDEQAAFLARFRLQTVHTPQRAADVLERVTLQGAHGVRKALLDFGMEDVRAFRAKAEGEVNGWSHRVGVMAEYEAMLTKHKAASGRALPDTAIVVLRRKAAEAWA